MMLLWSIIFFILGIVLGALAFGGIAIAVSFFTKVLFLFSLICFLIAFILLIIEKMQTKDKNL